LHGEHPLDDLRRIVEVVAGEPLAAQARAGDVE